MRPSSQTIAKSFMWLLAGFSIVVFCIGGGVLVAEFFWVLLAKDTVGRTEEIRNVGLLRIP